MVFSQDNDIDPEERTERSSDIIEPVRGIRADETDKNYSSTRKTEIKERLSDNDDQEEGQAVKLEKVNFETLIDSLRKLVNILRERGGKRIGLLLAEDGAGKIMQGANNIEKLLIEEKTDLAGFNNELMEIISALDKMGTAGKRGGLHEDLGSLGKLKRVLGQIEEGCHMALIRSAKDGSGESNMAMTSLGKLFSVAQAKKVYISDLHASFDKFHRR